MPVSKNKFILFGRIIKAHGFDGVVMIALEKCFKEEIPEVELVFVDVEGKPVPFFVSSIRESTYGTVIIRFDDYDSKDRISEFIGSEVYLEADKIEDSDITNSPMIISYKLETVDGKFSGTIIRIIDLPMQYLLVVQDKQGSEVFIPYTDDWIVETDHNKQIIIMDLPDGITDIN